MHFSLVKMNPDDLMPSHGFDDAIFPLYYSLQSLGYDVEILFNSVNARSKNIIFGSAMAPRRIGRMLPKGSVIFNLEQITPESKWCNKDYLAHLHDFTVWDYSPANVSALADAGLSQAVHVPLGYVPQMTRLRSGFAEDVDMLFYGLMTDRRHAVISRMTAAGIHILATQEAFGNMRDRLLAHSRLILNIHQFVPARLELVRLGYVWANKKAVLSEWRADTEIPDHLQEACCFTAYEALPETAAAMLARPGQIQKQAEAGFAAFTSKPMPLSLEKVLGRRNRAVPAPFLPPPGPLPAAASQSQSAYSGSAWPEWLITKSAP